MSDKKIQCIAFIMDGNRRWAREQGKETWQGHTSGAETLKEVIGWVVEADIPHAIFYAFSTENWKRSEAEVSALMELFVANIQELLQTAEKQNFSLQFVGKRNDLPERLQVLINEAEEKTASYGNTTIWVALSYGGRAEIIKAVNQAVANGEAVTEDSFSKLLWTADMPDPDLLIRTGGEKRLSNFLLWQSVYSELMFTDTYWPAFTKDEFLRMVEQYAERERRKGA